MILSPAAHSKQIWCEIKQQRISSIFNRAETHTLKHTKCKRGAVNPREEMEKKLVNRGITAQLRRSIPNTCGPVSPRAQPVPTAATMQDINKNGPAVCIPGVGHFKAALTARCKNIYKTSTGRTAGKCHVV